MSLIKKTPPLLVVFVSSQEIVIELAAKNNAELRIDIIKIKQKTNVYVFQKMNVELGNKTNKMKNSELDMVMT